MHELISRHDRDAEAAVVMSLITNPEQFDGPYGVWPQEAFYVETHRRIYAAAWALWRDDRVTDLHLIAGRLRDAKQYQAAGEVAGLLAWAWESPTFSAWMLPAYARRMRKLYAEREKGKAALQYQQSIADGGDEHEARVILDSVLDALDALDPETITTDDIVQMLGSAARFPTGYPDLDRQSGGGLTRPGLNVLAARPSVGKSALARGIIRRAVRDGHSVFWYSGDQSTAQIFELEIASLRRSDTREVARMPEEDLRAAVDEVRAGVWRDRVHLVDRPVELPRILSMARASRAQLVVIDYLQAVDSGVRESEYESVTRVSKALKGLALEMRVPVLALSQLSRQTEANEAPSLNHLRASGQIEQDADQVWGLQRDTSLSSADRQPATLHILKNKTGPTGNVRLLWHGHFASYESIGRL